MTMDARGRSGRTSPLLLLALAGAVGLALASVAAPDPGPPVAVCPEGGCESSLVETPALRLTADEACRDAGYLCAQLSSARGFRVQRWTESRRALRVRVEGMDHEEPQAAAALRRAATRGINAWQGRPFPLTIDDRAASPDAEADIVVRWTRQLDGVALGTTRTRWESGPAGATFTSVEVSLATRNPYNGQFKMTPEDIELVAAHEMGHALGLPHSDHEADLMYPTNAASRLSARDYRTMSALYRLPNGAQVVMDESTVAAGSR